MNRTRFIPHDQDWEDQQAEERAERKVLRTAPCEVVNDEDDRFGDEDPNAPEFDSIEHFARYMYDDERAEYTRFELACLNARHRVPTYRIKQELAGYGLTLERRPIEREGRGFKANSHDRWVGNPMAGGGGGGSIYGMCD